MFGISSRTFGSKLKIAFGIILAVVLGTTLYHFNRQNLVTRKVDEMRMLARTEFRSDSTMKDVQQKFSSVGVSLSHVTHENDGSDTATYIFDPKAIFLFASIYGIADVKFRNNHFESCEISIKKPAFAF